MKCVLVCAGEYNNEYDYDKNDFIIAVDGGLEYLNKNNIKPNLILGDFDSFEGMIPIDIETIRLNPVKDDTDTLSAIKEGIKRGFDEFIIYGALGGRIAHSISNIQSLIFLKKAGKRGIIISKDEIVEILYNENITLNKSNKGYFSLFSLSDNLELSVENAKYEIVNYKMSNSFPIGIDNEFIGLDVNISTKNGYLLLIYENTK